MTGLQMVNNSKQLLESCETIIKLHNERKCKNGICLLTHIENKKDHVDLIKKYLDMGFYAKHLSNLPPISFGVSEIQVESTIDKMVGCKMAQ